MLKDDGSGISSCIWGTGGTARPCSTVTSSDMFDMAMCSSHDPKYRWQIGHFQGQSFQKSVLNCICFLKMMLSFCTLLLSCRQCRVASVCFFSFLFLFFLCLCLLIIFLALLSSLCFGSLWRIFCFNGASFGGTPTNVLRKIRHPATQRRCSFLPAPGKPGPLHRWDFLT